MDHPAIHHDWSVGRSKILDFAQHWTVQSYSMGILSCVIFLWVEIHISQKFAAWGPIYYKSSSVQVIVSNRHQSITLDALRLRQYDRHSADDIFKCVFFYENIWIFINIWLRFVSSIQIKSIPSFSQIMAWHQLGDMPLSELMVVNLLTHICVT